MVKKTAPLIAGLILLLMAGWYLASRDRVSPAPGSPISTPPRSPTDPEPPGFPGSGAGDTRETPPEPREPEALPPAPVESSKVQESSGKTGEFLIDACSVHVERVDFKGKTAFRVSTRFMGPDMTAPKLTLFADQEGVLAINSDERAKVFEAHVKVSPRENDTVWLDLSVVKMENGQIRKSTTRSGLLQLNTPHTFK